MLEQILIYKEFTGLSAITLAFLVAGAIIIYNNRTVDRRSRRTFLDVINSLVLIVVLDWFTYVTSGLPELGTIHAVCMAIMFSLAPAIPVSIANAMFPKRHLKILLTILVVHAVFQFGSIIGGYVFWIDADNFYHRGPLYIVYIAVYTASALYLVVQSVRVGQIYQSASIVAVIAILGCLITGVVIQVFDTTVRMTWPSVSMTVILYFLFYSDTILRSDALTMLLNRRSFDEFVSKPVLPCEIVVIDVDDFKNVNDTYGHAYGDECLISVADAMRKAFGSAGLCFRTGGDEFMVAVVKQVAPLEETLKSLQSIIAAAQSEDSRLPNISIGYAHAPADCSDLTEIVEQADQSMYESKRAKK